MVREQSSSRRPAIDRGAPRLALLAIGCSAGSLPTLTELIRGVPTDLPAAVLICQHTTQHGSSNLPEILARSLAMAADWAVDGASLQPGRIYVAPPGHHLMVDRDRARLSNGPRVNRHRPSVDVLFASAATAFGPAATVVVLSGVLDDGAAGAALIDRAGGQVLVQDPETAQFDGMPRAAMKAAPNAVIAKGRMSDDVVEAVRRATERTTMEGPMERGNAMEPDSASRERPFLQAGESQLVRLSCPDCGGGLAQVDLPQISYFRCHVGHQYGPQTLVAAMSEASEAKLWSAVAALEEEALLQGYVETLPSRAPGQAPPSGARRRSRDLWNRAAELRGHTQKWTKWESSTGQQAEGQLSLEDPS